MVKTNKHNTAHLMDKISCNLAFQKLLKLSKTEIKSYRLMTEASKYFGLKVQEQTIVHYNYRQR